MYVLYLIFKLNQEFDLCLKLDCKQVYFIIFAFSPCLPSELHHKKAIPVPTPSPPEMVTTSSPVVETLLQSGPRKGKILDSVITNQKIELMDATVKIEEMPLTVPLLNHGHSISVKTETIVNNVILKKNSAEKVSTNKKSPRKQIPTRGKNNNYVMYFVLNWNFVFNLH